MHQYMLRIVARADRNVTKRPRTGCSGAPFRPNSAFTLREIAKSDHPPAIPSACREQQEGVVAIFLR
jgi:hypothetical protein